MIVGEAMQAWIADKAAQRETRARADAFACAWNAGPEHRRFEETMAGIAAPTAEAVAEAVCALLADEDWLDAMLAALVERMRADPWFDPPLRSLSSDVHTGLLVFESDMVSIAAGVTSALQLAARKNRPRAATSVGFSGQLSVFKFVRSGGARLSFWEVPALDGNFSAANAGTCRRVGERDIEDGEIFVLDGRRQSYVVERLHGSFLLVQASIHVDQAPLSAEYDSATGAFVGCAATGDTSSRIQMITTLLRKLDHQAAFPAMAAFLDHADFFVRWHVMKELLGLDAAAALPHLKRMAASDPHPEPRRAARLVLDRIEGRSPAPKRQAA
jgi:HEAT repeat protein